MTKPQKLFLYLLHLIITIISLHGLQRQRDCSNRRLDLMRNIGQIFRKIIFRLYCGLFRLIKERHRLINFIFQFRKIILSSRRKDDCFSHIRLFQILCQTLDTHAFLFVSIQQGNKQKAEARQNSCCHS